MFDELPNTLTNFETIEDGGLVFSYNITKYLGSINDNGKIQLKFDAEVIKNGTPEKEYSNEGMTMKNEHLIEKPDTYKLR